MALSQLPNTSCALGQTPIALPSMGIRCDVSVSSITATSSSPAAEVADVNIVTRGLNKAVTAPISIFRHWEFVTVTTTIGAVSEEPNPDTQNQQGHARDSIATEETAELKVTTRAHEPSIGYAATKRHVNRVSPPPALQVTTIPPTTIIATILHQDPYASSATPISTQTETVPASTITASQVSATAADLLPAAQINPPGVSAIFADLESRVKGHHGSATETADEQSGGNPAARPSTTRTGVVQGPDGAAVRNGVGILVLALPAVCMVLVWI